MQGRATEARIARKKKARLHPNSGAGKIKDDASDDAVVYEIKDANKSFTLSGKSLHETWQRAVRQGKESRWIVYFTALDMTAEIHLTKGQPDGR